MLKSTLSRRTINTICDGVLPVPSVDSVASKYATKYIKENIKNQMIGLEMRQTAENIQALKNFVSIRQSSALVKDDTPVGLSAAEGLSVSLAQMPQDAFKSVGQSGTVNSDTIDAIKSVLYCVKDRSDPRTIVHFDKDYAEGLGFTLKEVVSMRSIFVKMCISDFLSSDGMILGVMEDFEGDGVRKKIRELREVAISSTGAPVINSMLWNRINAARGIHAGIYTLRLYLDRQKMYSHNVTIGDIINALYRESGEDISNRSSIIGSTLREAIIDITLIDEGLSGSMDIDTSEHVFLNIIRDSLSSIKISGMDKILGLHPTTYKLRSAITDYKKADKYRTSEEGMKKWMKNNNIDLPWDRVEYNVYRTFNEAKNNAIVIHDDVVYSEVELDDGTPLATEDEITDAYISNITDDLDNTWILTLDILTMNLKCISHDYIMRMLEYCDIEVIHLAKHETVSKVGYIYVRSSLNPKTIIDSRMGIYNYDTVLSESSPLSQRSIDLLNKEGNVQDLLSSGKYTVFSYEDNYIPGTVIPLDAPLLGRKMARYLAKECETEEQLRAILINPKRRLERIFIYVYAIMETEKKDDKNHNMFQEHVVNHPCYSIMRHPFVDRTRTYSNDWYNTCFFLGCEISMNIYVTEPVTLFSECGTKTDPRYIDMMGHYIYESGVPSGISVYGQKNAGIVTRIITEKTKRQIKTAFTREPNSMIDPAASNYVGAVLIRGEGTKEKYVKQFDTMSEIERLRLDIRYGRKKLNDDVKETVTNDDAIKIMVKSMLMEKDPYQTIPTFELASNTEFMSITIPYTPFISSATTVTEVMRQINKDALSIVGRIRNRRNFRVVEEKIKTLPPTAHIVELDSLINYIKANQSSFVRL